MIRNLKVLVAAALALAAIGAVSGSAARAANFHCNTMNCRYRLVKDGTGTTAHHVWVIETRNTIIPVNFTCGELKGEGSTAAETAAEVTFENLEYPSAGCKVNGSPGVTIDMNGCKYRFSSAGTVSVTGCTNAAKAIEITIVGGCTFTIPESSAQNMTGIDFHTIGSTPNREITVEIRHLTLEGVSGTKSCEALIGSELTGLAFTYLTGNFIITGETQASVMKDCWFE